MHHYLYTVASDSSGIFVDDALIKSFDMPLITIGLLYDVYVCQEIELGVNNTLKEDILSILNWRFLSNTKCLFNTFC